MYANYLSVVEGTPLVLQGWVDVEIPLSQRNGTFVFDLDVTQARSALTGMLVPYVNDGYITQEQADAIMRNVNGVYFLFEFSIDLRLTGNAR